MRSTYETHLTEFFQILTNNLRESWSCIPLDALTLTFDFLHAIFDLSLRAIYYISHLLIYFSLGVKLHFLFFFSHIELQQRLWCRLLYEIWGMFCGPASSMRLIVCINLLFREGMTGPQWNEFRDAWMGGNAFCWTWF